jgi:hypothetical protein
MACVRYPLINRRRQTVVGGAVALAVLLVGGAIPAVAASDDDKYQGVGARTEFNPNLVKAWREAEVPTPAYPREADLVAVTLAPADRLKLFVDASSVALADDRVLRATLVVESSSGARNVFFEGIRCETREYKTYAIGNTEKQWSPVKPASWRELPPAAGNNFRFYLFKHYVCDDDAFARSPSEVLHRIKHHQIEP